MSENSRAQTSSPSTTDSPPDLAALLTRAFSLLALQITGMDAIFQRSRGHAFLDEQGSDDYQRHIGTALRAQAQCTRAAATMGRLAQLKLLGGDGTGPKKKEPRKPVEVPYTFVKEDPATPGISKPLVIKTEPDTALAWLLMLCSNSPSAARTYNEWLTDGDHWKAGPIYPVVGFKMKAAALRELADQTEAEEKIATEALLKDMDERPWRPLAQAREKRRIEAENKAAAAMER